MPVSLSVVTPERPLVQAEAETVVLPGEEGEFGVLPQHEAFLAPLRAGILRYESAAQTHEIEITGGFAQVTADQVTVLADSARLVG